MHSFRTGEGGPQPIQDTRAGFRIGSSCLGSSLHQESGATAVVTYSRNSLRKASSIMAMLRVPVTIFFMATAWAQELSQQELEPALAADDECADGGDTCVVELLQARASKDARAEHTISAEKIILEAGSQQLLQQNATANATANASQPPCRGINEACWINNDCCSARCGLTRRCRPVR
ncbi:unnamed protein product [Prorocentrum cordatum]|uniref:WAP domain-containing protein n=1 Tax=Prorocentrum cordatum TaxID=2364126 RepID=A0ABN9T4W7_9DINO|nr:unnamed protein product [Polarella glacialis]